MGFFSSIFSGIAKIFSPVTNVVKKVFGFGQEKPNILQSGARAVGGSVVGSVGNALINKGTGIINNKIQGVPTPPGIPGAARGKQAGQNQADFLNASFPGTTPWEQLGAGSPMGQIASAGINAKTQQTLQRNELAMRDRIVDKQTKAGLIGAATPFGTEAIKTVLNAQKGFPMEDFTSRNWELQQKLENTLREIPNIKSGDLKQAAGLMIDIIDTRMKGVKMEAKTKMMQLQQFMQKFNISKQTMQKLQQIISKFKGQNDQLHKESINKSTKNKPFKGYEKYKNNNRQENFINIGR